MGTSSQPVREIFRDGCQMSILRAYKGCCAYRKYYGVETGRGGGRKHKSLHRGRRRETMSTRPILTNEPVKKDGKTRKTGGIFPHDPFSRPGAAPARSASCPLLQGWPLTMPRPKRPTIFRTRRRRESGFRLETMTAQMLQGPDSPHSRSVGRAGGTPSAARSTNPHAWADPAIPR